MLHKTDLQQQGNCVRHPTAQQRDKVDEQAAAAMLTGCAQALLELDGEPSQTSIVQQAMCSSSQMHVSSGVFTTRNWLLGHTTCTKPQ